MSDVSEFAKLDYQREQRCGFPEVVFAEGKTANQVSDILAALAHEHRVALATRVLPEQAHRAKEQIKDANYLPSCSMLYVDRRDAPLRINGNSVGEIIAQSDDLPVDGGLVVVCCAGTSDLPVAEEAAVTARIMGSRVKLLTDIGIAGVHRALAHTELLGSARVIVAVAGTEGALPSLVAGLVDVPVIAVPTSVGYGASFGGLAALLGMLNSCASGVSVVNINNGFGAGVIAHRINLPNRKIALYHSS